MPRFVRAPDVGDLSELFRPPCDLRFVKTSLGENRLNPFDVALDVEEERRQIDVVSPGNGGRRNTTRARPKERAFAFPVPWFSGRAGDNVVSRVDDGVDRREVVEIHNQPN